MKLDDILKNVTKQKKEKWKTDWLTTVWSDRKQFHTMGLTIKTQWIMGKR